MMGRLANYLRRKTVEAVNGYWNRCFEYQDYKGEARSLHELRKQGARCADYVYWKGQGLRGRGFELPTLEVGIGYSEGTGHSVLIVDGWWVLDNRHKDVYPLSRLKERGVVLSDRLPFAQFAGGNA